jgi:hypothetical protein
MPYFMWGVMGTPSPGGTLAPHLLTAN